MFDYQVTLDPDKHLSTGTFHDLQKFITDFLRVTTTNDSNHNYFFKKEDINALANMPAGASTTLLMPTDTSNRRSPRDGQLANILQTCFSDVTITPYYRSYHPNIDDKPTTLNRLILDYKLDHNDKTQIMTEYGLTYDDLKTNLPHDLCHQMWLESRVTFFQDDLLPKLIAESDDNILALANIVKNDVEIITVNLMTISQKIQVKAAFN